MYTEFQKPQERTHHKKSQKENEKVNSEPLKTFLVFHIFKLNENRIYGHANTSVLTVMMNN